MKNFEYKANEFETHSEVLTAIRDDLKTIELPISIHHKAFGDGTIVNITAPDKGSSLYVAIDFATINKVFALDILISRQMLVCDEALIECLTAYQNAFRAIYETAELIAKEERRLERERQAQLREEAKQQAEYKQKMQAINNKIQKLKPMSICSEPRTKYEIIGWLARNIGTISASINSDYEQWFVKNFGNAPHGVIDSKAKTKNGDPMKYSISFKASLKTEAPETLIRLDGIKSRSIDSVEYIWDLIENYGFQFGKQDISNIRNYIPAEYITEFENGLGPEPESKTTKIQKTA
jgi:hypothetical protein